MSCDPATVKDITDTLFLVIVVVCATVFIGRS